MNRFRLRWAAPWSDRPAKSILQLDHMEGEMILRQFLLTREDAKWLASEIKKFLKEPQ